MLIKLYRKIKSYYMRKTTIFKQLILNVVIPAVLALLILGTFNYNQTKSNLRDSIDTKNTGVSLELDNETLDVLLNPIKTTKDIIDNSRQIGHLTVAAGGMIKAGYNHDAGIFNTLDAVGIGFDITNGVADVARSESDLKNLLLNTENQDAATLQNTASQAFIGLQEDVKKVYLDDKLEK